MDKLLRTVGATLAVLGGALMIAWALGRNTDRHGAVFLFFGGVALASVGGSLLSLGYALRPRSQKGLPGGLPPNKRLERTRP